MYTLKPPVNATILALQHVLKLCLFKLRCKLWTGDFPTFPNEKRFVNLPSKEKPVLLRFKKLVQRK